MYAIKSKRIIFAIIKYFVFIFVALVNVLFFVLVYHLSCLFHPLAIQVMEEAKMPITDLEPHDVKQYVHIIFDTAPTGHT